MDERIFDDEHVLARHRAQKDPILKSKRTLKISLLECSNRDDFLMEALKVLRENLQVQSASVFLLNKFGLLERVHINSIDINAENINEDQWSRESYRPGESFTGSIINDSTLNSYWDPKIVHFPQMKVLNGSGYEKLAMYSNKLGEVKSIAAFPLDNRNGSYGVLEVVNKVNVSENGDTVTTNAFTDEDIVFLSDFSDLIESGISDLRHEEKLQRLAKLGQKLVKARVHNNLETALKSALMSFVAQSTPFRACILRVVEEDHKLKVVARAKASGIDFESRDDGDRIVGEGFAGKTFREKRNRWFLINESNLSKFKNSNWIEKNQLKSFGCFPLIVDGRIVGTLSLFSGYGYVFHKDTILFIESATSIIATFIYKEKLEGWKRELQKDYWIDSPELDSGLEKLNQLNVPHLADLVVGLTSSEISGAKGEGEDTLDCNVTEYEALLLDSSWLKENEGKYAAFVDGEWIRSSADGTEQEKLRLLDWLTKTELFQNKNRFFTKVDVDSPIIIEEPMSSFFDGAILD